MSGNGKLNGRKIIYNDGTDGKDALDNLWAINLQVGSEFPPFNHLELFS
jgi:hypothetical protein